MLGALEIVAHLEKKDLLWQALESVIADEGMKLYDAERVGDNVLRVAVDRSVQTQGPEAGETGAGAESWEAAGQGVTSGDCTVICKRLIVYFCAEGAQFGLRPDVQIEVSSPGVNRELRLPEHFAGAVGQRVKIIPRHQNGGAAGSGKSNGSLSGPVIGCLRSFRENVLEVLDEQTKETVKLPFAEVKKANVDFKF